MAVPSCKRQLQKSLSAAGLLTCLDTGAFKVLQRFIEAEPQNQHRLPELLERLKSLVQESGRITQQRVQPLIDETQGMETEVELVHVLNAFELPRMAYDEINKKLYADQSARSLVAPAEDKHKLYLGRMLILLQRLRRNKMFERKGILMQAAGVAPQAQLTELMALKGMTGQERIVLGCITMREDGRYVLEDASVSLQIDISAALTTAGFFTENCVVVAQGALGHDGIFHVYALGLPPCEPSSALPGNARGLNYFGGPVLSNDEQAQVMMAEAQHEDDRIVFMSDVHLDKQQVLESLHFIFQSYQDNDFIPQMIVLMGNFTSRSCNSSTVNYQAIQDSFTQLAHIIERYPQIKEGSRFVFVPGPGDAGLSTLLPQPPLPVFLTAELRRVLPTAVFTSNPCRIKYCTREIVVFRYDLLKKLRRHCLMAPKVDEDVVGDGSQVLFDHMARTVLEQSHLCPLPLTMQPIYWQHDHALQLYPLPHAVVIADASQQAQHHHEGCSVFNPAHWRMDTSHRTYHANKKLRCPAYTKTMRSQAS